MKAKAKEITPQELAGVIRRHPRVVALTGAGISVESGIPDFRSAGGLWSRFDPLEYAYIRAFRTNPAKVWAMLKEMDAVITRARPNPAHFALAELEARGFLAGIITQNVDNLHQAAGSKRVVEYHGNARRFVCDTCRGHHPRETLDFAHPPLYCLCGGLIRPDVRLFRGGHPPGGPGRGRGPGPALRPDDRHRHLGRSGPGQLHPGHRQGMERGHRGGQPGIHAAHLQPHRPLPERLGRKVAAAGFERTLGTGSLGDMIIDHSWVIRLTNIT